MPNHPYTEAPDTAFWSRSVAKNWNPTALVDGSLKIHPHDRVASAGSCFAANIVPFLANSGIEYIRTEPRHDAFADIFKDRFGYTSFSAAYGNIYTARQLLQLVKRAKGDFRPIEDRWPSPDGIVDPFRPGLPYRAQDDTEFDALIGQHLANVRRALEQATTFVFTLGLTEAWISRKDGAVFPVCPGTIAGEFDPNAHEFRNFSTSEIANDLLEFCELIWRINNNCRVILTVSPVPLVATATSEHVLVASTYSKSVLRAAAGEVSRIAANAVYFPSYEIITGPQAPDSFFEDDRRNVSTMGVEAVMGALLGDAFVPVTSHAAPAPNQASLLSAFVAERECEEGALDPGGSALTAPAIAAPGIARTEPPAESLANTKIVFLHIPKTAGQALRQFLEMSFPRHLMFPGFVDADLLTRSKDELDRFQMFSGHFSPALLDSISGPTFKFSVLREPSDRIVSMYRYLRSEAQKKTIDALKLPANRLHKAALDQPIDVFLQANECDQLTRQLILSGCYNFYAYYFGARFQTARAITDSDDPNYTYGVASNLVEKAVSNIERDGTKIYFFDSLSRLVTDLAALPNSRPAVLNAVNANPGGVADRNEFIEREASNPARARELLHMYAEFDRKIYDYFYR